MQLRSIDSRRSCPPLNIAEGAGCAGPVEFAKFLSYAYRSLKEVVTSLELCQRLYPGMSVKIVANLVDEGNQIARMTHRLMNRLGLPPDLRHA